jgi:hypothetical protein
MLAAVVGIAFTVATVGVWAWTAPRHWRGESRLSGDDAPLWFPFSEPVWRGVVRSYVVWAPCIALFMGGAVVAALSPENSAVYNAGMAAATVGLFGGTAIHLPILFFNRPKFLVPPSLRSEPGAIEAWRGARASRRQRL